MTRKLFMAAAFTSIAVVLAAAVGLWLSRDIQADRDEIVWRRLREARVRKDYRTVSECLKEAGLADHLSVDERIGLADEMSAVGRFTAAEQILSQILKGSPDSKMAHRKLGILKHVTGRPDLAREHWQHLLNFGGMDLLTFPLVRNTSLRLPDQDQALEHGLREEIPDPLACLGLAVRALQQSQLDDCQTLLEKIPPSLDTRLCLAELLYRRGNFSGLSQALAVISRDGRETSTYWIMRGHYYRSRNEITLAARCYWEACRVNVSSYSATEELARCLRELQRPKEADLLAVRSRALMNYSEVCRAIHHSHEIVERYLIAAEQYAADLSLTADALTWCQFARIAFPEAGWPQQRINDHQARLKSSRSPTESRSEWHRQIDLSHIPLPEMIPDYHLQTVDNTGTVDIRFENRAAPLGLEFVYEDGADTSTVETALFEFTGGGVAVIDYDQDAWPDLFFPQGGSPPAAQSTGAIESSDRLVDLLVRNTSGGALANVTSGARIRDTGYSQGATAGDFNSDGWCDLYVANIGSNCLLMNCGDGTFLHVETAVFKDAASWTTTCALVDLNQDGWPDIYDANYVPLDSVHTLMCRKGDASVPCGTVSHPEAAQDRLLINGGDGTFTDRTDSAGIVLPEGLALGMIVSDFDQNGSLDVFVANDGRRNFLFLNQSISPLRFSDEALERGLAYSGTGRAQACMGIAADDLTGDGVLDLFITNFYADYNTLYRQLPGALFRDETNDCGLHAVSYYSLGFGTQALDADLDGDPDIVLTNGDVADFSSSTPGRSYRQSPQFLLNRGGGRFNEVSPAQLGEFFQGRYLGRGLARLDYDRDGREDFAVSHIGSPAALVANRTEPCGHFLSLQLVGTAGARDAVGTQVSVRSDSTEWKKQLNGGDGYMASNQRRLHFGIGECDDAADVTVTWPSQVIEDFGRLPVDREYVLVEGAGKAFRLAVAAE